MTTTTPALLRHRVLPDEVKASTADRKAIAAEVKGAATLALGDAGEGVKALQRKLRGIGAYAGPVNGTFDAATEAAVKVLQAGRKLPVTGVLDSKELAEINKLQLVVKEGFETVARVGQNGSDIRQVEAKLAQLGFDTGKVDGTMDAKTLAALLKFRKADATVPDKGDMIGRRVLPALNHQINVVESELALLGGKPGSIDTRFTKATEKALLAFQKKQGLKQTGEADGATRRALAKASENAGRFPDVKPSGFQHGFDTSHFQSDATFNAALNQKSTRFMGIKATEGTTFTDPTFKKRWDQLGKKLEPGKFDLRVAYHFLTPGNGRAQADHFLKTLGIHGPLTPGTRLALDWEASALGSPATLKAAAERVHEVTGTWPLIYTSLSQIPRAKAAVPHAPMWDAHWSENAGDFKFPFVQTSGTGIDRDVFTGSELALRKWAGWF